MSHLDEQDARKSVATCAMEPGRRFPPSVGDIIANVGTDDRDWWDAWLEVHAACEGGSGRCRTDSDDPLVVEFVGQLSEWREQVDEGSSTLRAQFREFYRQRSDRQEKHGRAELADSVLEQLDGPALRQIGAGA